MATLRLSLNTNLFEVLLITVFILLLIGSCPLIFHLCFIHSETEAATSAEKEDIARQNEALKKELENVRSQAAAAVQKANTEAKKQVEEAQADMLTREKELAKRISSQVQELLGQCLCLLSVLIAVSCRKS